MTSDDDEPFLAVDPDDPAEATRYLQRLEWRYPRETAAADPAALRSAVAATLELCPPLRIDDPKEILRFVALVVHLTTAQKRSALLTTVIYRVLMATGVWGARKRLNFIYKMVVGRPPPKTEPDFGIWFIADSRFAPRVAPADLVRSIFSPLERRHA